MILTPWTGILSIEGRISYGESSHSWNTIRFTKEIVDEFPVLRDRKAKVSYKLEQLRTIENLNKRVKEIEKENKGVPLLLYIYLDEPVE